MNDVKFKLTKKQLRNDELIRQDSKMAAQFDWRQLGSDGDESDLGAQLAEIGFGVNMNQQVKNSQKSKESEAKAYFEDMQKLTPEYRRYEASLSAFILKRILDYCTQTIFTRMQEYMKKFKMSRELFIKIFNLYCSLSFMTVLRKIKKTQRGSKDEEEG